ncbi:MAG: tetratricopeptide repeat protein [Flavihumibacter sp.]|nr:tetratricopeptide repeat protein [Flavihumibacter sp.]
MKWYYIVLICLSTSCNTKTAEEYLQEGHAAGVTGNYTQAIALFDKAIATDPQLKEAYIKKAFSYENLKKDKAAVAAYKALLAIDTANTRALFSAARCCYRMKQFTEAISFYNKALQAKGIIHPTDTMNRKQITISRATKATNGFDVPLYEIYFNRGIAYYANLQYPMGFYDFETCIAQNYLPGDCNYFIGLYWLNKQDAKKACESFRVAAVLYGNAEARKQLLQHCK